MMRRLLFCARFRNFYVIFALPSVLFAIFYEIGAAALGYDKMIPPIIQIVDETGGRDLAGSTLESLPDSPFKRYIVRVNQHMATIAEQTAGASPGAVDLAQVTLIFRFQPLIASGAVSRPAAPLPDGVVRLQSPWVRISQSPPPEGGTAITFWWSERQFLMDQALMDDPTARASMPGSIPPMPLDEDAYRGFVQDYMRSVLPARSEEQADALAAARRRMPPDVFWLLHHARQGTLAPFTNAVSAALHDLNLRVEAPYAALTSALLDRAFGLGAAAQHYDSVLDLSGIYDIDAYRMRTLM